MKAPRNWLSISGKGGQVAPVAGMRASSTANVREAKPAARAKAGVFS
ncbi:hypothetical protein HMPREF9080_00070 [Cardiobacterium valvarum F0432]|uniref:Uncharacterized protein n=1 Tax=Cardiobacterium valvarum F0432 TaxID=797473 RepID=G9ZBE7_9GAMM|nr:hypothetical protein HMPREF9080_00070 [Cardiobacterium valvarum F0432]